MGAWQVSEFNPATDSALQAMMKEAESSGKWFFCHYHQLWFSPAELLAQWDQGNFRWGAGNWKLRDPGEKEEQIKAGIESLNEELRRFRERGK